jgi:ABC-type microcin C transport system duplicated ATPase subunit YejF
MNHPDTSRDKATMTPIQLAEEIIKVVGDADSGTALTALQIARLLLLHRDDSASEFQRQCLNEASERCLEDSC